MKSYKIVYCFTDINGVIETNENGEVIYTEIVEADNVHQALSKLIKKEKFIEIPDILDLVEVKI